jgi:hypothetical protein
MAATLPIDRALLREPNLWLPGREPIGPVKIDTTHPLSQNLRVYTLCESVSATNLAGPNNFEPVTTYGDAPVPVITERGRAVNNEADHLGFSALVGANNVEVLSPRYAVTIMCICKSKTHQSSAGSPFGKGNSGNSNEIAWMFKVYPTYVDFFVNTDNGAKTARGAALNEDQWYCLIGTYDRRFITYYVDGILDKQEAGGNGAMSAQDQFLHLLQGSPGDSVRSFEGEVAMAAMWGDRALTASEAMDISKDPYQMLVPA